MVAQIIFVLSDYDVWLVKTDADGVEEWMKRHDGTDFDFGWSIVESSDGGYVIQTI